VRTATANVDPNWGKVVVTLDNGATPIGTATVGSNGTFTASVTIPAGTSAGTHTIHAVNQVNADHRPATATVNMQVTAATPGPGPGPNLSQGTMMMVALLQGETGCPTHPINSTTTADTFMLTGGNFSPGSVTIHLDSQTGTVLGTATVGAGGTFCQRMNAPPKSQAGKHTLVA